MVAEEGLEREIKMARGKSEDRRWIPRNEGKLAARNATPERRATFVVVVEREIYLPHWPPSFFFLKPLACTCACVYVRVCTMSFKTT